MLCYKYRANNRNMLKLSPIFSLPCRFVAQPLSCWRRGAFFFLLHIFDTFLTFDTFLSKKRKASLFLKELFHGTEDGGCGRIWQKGSRWDGGAEWA